MVRKILGLLLFFSGLFLISQGLLQFAKREGIFIPNESTVQLPIDSEVPSFIELPETKINLPIFETEIVDKKWPTSESGVSYIRSSGKLGVSGNHVMYGHNWKSLLGKLSSSKVGDNLTILSNQNKEYKFQIKYIAVVEANDVSILADTIKERLTLYTCTGPLDSRRLVVVAERVES